MTKNISLDRYKQRFFGEFLNIPGLTEIAVNRPDELFTKVNGEWKQHRVSLTYEESYNFARCLAKHHGDNIEDIKPGLSATLESGERCQVVVPPACERDTVSITIRKPSRVQIPHQSYIDAGFYNRVTGAEKVWTHDDELIELYNTKNIPRFMEKCVEYDKTIAVARETSTGKTTYMKTLIGYIPVHLRISTIEDNPEITFFIHKNYIHLFYPSESSDEKGGAIVTPASLLRWNYRMNPDRILLTEVRGAEAWDFLKITGSGHEGSMTSIVLREAPRQWVNPTPMIDRMAIKKATPPCTITINRQGSLSLHDVSERITRVCHIPVSVTPDALTLLGGVSGGQTQQMKGDIPPPDVNGMVPLAAIGMASSSAPAAVNTGANLNGLYWNGPLAGLLDTIASRLGVSWRYESGQIVIYALETRSFTLNFMDSQTDYQSRVVSGTTSKAGNSGGQSGNALSGDATTSQSTSTTIKSSLYADLQGAVRSMLTPGLGRMFLSAGNLTVTDVPRVLDTVERFVDERNQTLDRQVVLNIEVLSVEKRQKDQLGLDWNAVFNNGRLGLSLSQAFGGAAGNIMNGGFSVVDGRLAGSKVFLNALAEQAKVSVVTQQSNTTTNLSPVAMQVAEQEDYVAQVTTQSTANVGTATSIQPATITTGFYINLLPNIMPDGQHLLLQFAINLSEPPTRRTFTSGESSVELLNTQLKTFTQRVKMKTGQTLVLSGFQQASRKGSKQGVGQPGFFGLGGGQQAEDGDRMLVVLITPVLSQEG